MFQYRNMVHYGWAATRDLPECMEVCAEEKRHPWSLVGGIKERHRLLFTRIVQRNIFNWVYVPNEVAVVILTDRFQND